MKKRYLALFVILLMLIAITGCSKEEKAATEGQIRAVTVQEIQTSEKPVQLSYIGTLDAKEIIKYSFKTGGQIGRVFVEKGASVKKGDKLVELDKNDLEFQVSSARTTMESAKESMSYIQANFDRMKILYDQGAVSKDQYEQLRGQANNARLQYEAAATNYEYQLSLERDATIYAEQDGMVVELMSQENERVNPFTPVISVRSIEEVINVGIPQQDLKNIQLGSLADIDIDGQKAEGIISNIAEAPDPATRTYKAEVTVQGKDFRLGSIAKVAIDIGQEKGIWIPIAAVLSDGGDDYVYIVKESRAFKRTIAMIKQSENEIMVNDIKPGEYVVISGMKNLDDGAMINIVK